MKEAYLSWARKDPIDPFMHFNAYWYLPNSGRTTKELSDEALAILHEGIENGCSSCAKELAYHYLSLAESEDDLEAISKTKPYIDKTKEMMRLGLGRALPENTCFQSFVQYCKNEKSNFSDKECFLRQREEVKYGVCLSDDENSILLDEFAKKGDLSKYLRQFHNMNNYTEDYDAVDSLRRYINHGDTDNSLSPRIKQHYDRAIELNNGRGWRTYSLTENIEKWERLLEDKDSRDFFEKVGELLDAKKE